MPSPINGLEFHSATCYDLMGFGRLLAEFEVVNSSAWVWGWFVVLLVCLFFVLFFFPRSF